MIPSKTTPLHPVTARRVPVAIVGGGQAGLAMSWLLKQRGIEHIVFERHRVAHEWREARWDSFCLVTPNWQCRLPGWPYAGRDPHGFMLKDEIVAYLEGYAASFAPPLCEGTSVTRLRPLDDGGFELKTTGGDWIAGQVVIATGGYHTPIVPRSAERLPASVLQLHSSNYRNPHSLPAGAVLVVGTGQSGCQIAEDLHLAGRQVHLAVGTAPRSPRVYRGKEVTDWLTESGYYDIAYEQHPQKETVREKTNHYLTGRDGGREIDLRRFAREGMQLYGRFDESRRDGEQIEVRFIADLKHNLDQADASYLAIRASIDQYIAARGIEAPPEAPYVPVWEPDAEPTSLDLQAAGITTVIWAIGFAADYRWVEAPLFDGRGRPVQRRGVTGVDGLYFLGLPWQNTWGSGRFADVGRDAEYLLEHIAPAQRDRRAAS
ncbi:MSMEG_0569 family flavin-dependent oxidoreductase [Solimonas variicoloris]|uniref:MSMEG_0569 family flavin-dependent oxidoreductase n=1 Tax=Solimonas variicoloris TaxID=254408 RepID=UPI0003762964|nr:MSMEG_0569 family flavin-dependent oxidoreductase [Solimonas variicoloris]